MELYIEMSLNYYSHKIHKNSLNNVKSNKMREKIYRIFIYFK